MRRNVRCQGLVCVLAIKPAHIAGHVAKTSEQRGATGRLGIADEGDRTGVAKNLPEALRAGDCGGGAGQLAGSPATTPLLPTSKGTATK